MTPQQQSIRFALDQLRRSPWPKAPVHFGESHGDLQSSISIDGLVHALRNGLLRADRWTCRIDSDDVRSAIAMDQSATAARPLIIHAIDADLAVPLLAHWFIAHRDPVVALADTLRTRAKSQVTLALPADLPGYVRRALKGVAGIHWIEPKYPAGHWRMLPYVLGMQRTRPVVLDVVAATDLAFAALNGSAPPLRPIALCDLSKSDPLDFRLIERGQPLEAVHPIPVDHEWLAGPRWRRRPISITHPVEDGELVFHVVPRKSEKQSPCVRCGWCEFICPTRCDPVALMNVLRDFNPRRADRAGLHACIDCGLCTNVCPSNLPLNLFIDELRLVAREAT